ncbi:hypothetical protein I6F53_09070 [Pseudoalteromonas sp. SWN29]|uniref:hypothetical protein n=1 Tax=Pseudoalteromonas sp. SWN29 TaxID=2792064 RepID=UPI0018CFDA2C|nr:hypothetical protein [Pseudoalteromonas sp. SWN29]MBH0027138.1 hypothetical protein [Pseudoalteromonas sp. SWN29]
MMGMLKVKLLEHIELYCKKFNLEISHEDIRSDFEDFISRISAPDDLSGLAQVFLLLKRMNHTSKKLWLFTKSELCLAEYICDAFCEYDVELGPGLKESFKRSSYKKGWCNEIPFYVLLIKSYEYKQDENSLNLLANFISHYFRAIDTLTDPELATSSSTREAEVCNKFRLLMKKSNVTFDLNKDHILIGYPEPTPSIVSKLEIIISNDIYTSHTTERGYLNTLIHFYKNDWQPARLHKNSYRDISTIAKRYKKSNSLPIAGVIDDLSVLIPFSAASSDTEGLNPEDSEVQMPFVIDNGSNTERDKTDHQSIKMVLSPASKKKEQIDITRNVHRAHNVAYQDIRLLKAPELRLLFDTLIKHSRSDINIELSVVGWLMFLLGKTFKEIKSLHIFYKLDDKKRGLFLDENGRGWWYFPLIQEAKTTLKNVGLISTEAEVFTACPTFLTDLIIKNLKGRREGLLINASDFSSLESSLSKKLKKVSDAAYSGRLSINSISNFIVNYINATAVIDPIFVDYSYDIKMYSTRVSRSYSNIDDITRCERLSAFWKEVESDYYDYCKEKLPVKLFELLYFDKQNIRLGSKFTPENQTVQNLITALTSDIDNAKLDSLKQLDAILEYHNAFTVYVAWMLMFGSGYRAVWNPLPTFSLYFPSLSLMGISDKDDIDFTHSRLVCLPSVLNEQIAAYQAHLSCLRGLIRVVKPKLCRSIDNFLNTSFESLNLDYTESCQWFKMIRNSRINHGPLFIFERQRSGVVTKSISPTQRRFSRQLSPKLLSSFFVLLWI